MSERLPNQTNLSRAEVWNLGVIATQLGVTSAEEMSSMLIVGYRMHHRGDEIVSRVEELHRLVRMIR